MTFHKTRLFLYMSQDSTRSQVVALVGSVWEQFGNFQLVVGLIETAMVAKVSAIAGTSRPFERDSPTSATFK